MSTLLCNRPSLPRGCHGPLLKLPSFDSCATRKAVGGQLAPWSMGLPLVPGAVRTVDLTIPAELRVRCVVAFSLTFCAQSLLILTTTLGQYRPISQATKLRPV